MDIQTILCFRRIDNGKFHIMFMDSFAKRGISKKKELDHYSFNEEIARQFPYNLRGRRSNDTDKTASCFTKQYAQAHQH